MSASSSTTTPATKRERPEDSLPSMYQLDMQQQPRQARMTGSGDKVDRRPVDPSPIVRLRIKKLSAMKKTGDLVDSDFVHPTLTHTLFCFASLVAGDNDDELFVITGSKSKHVMGSVVSSLFHLKDQSCFVFPDLSCRAEGTFRFKMSLYELVEEGVSFCTSIFTAPFQVYSSKRFPGMGESTELSRNLASQGLRLRVRRPVKNDEENEPSRSPAPAAASEHFHPSAPRSDLPPPPRLAAKDTHRLHPHPSESNKSQRKRIRLTNPTPPSTSSQPQRDQRNYGRSSAPNWRKNSPPAVQNHGLGIPMPYATPHPHPGAYPRFAGRGPYDQFPPIHPFPRAQTQSTTIPAHLAPPSFYPIQANPIRQRQLEPQRRLSPAGRQVPYAPRPTLPSAEPLRHSRSMSEMSQSSSGTSSYNTQDSSRGSFLPTPARSPDHHYERERYRYQQMRSPPEPRAMFATAESSMRTDEKEEEEMRKSGTSRSLAKLLGEGSTEVKDSIRDMDPQDFFS